MVSDQLDRTRLLEPGLIPFVPGVERHRVCGGGVCVIALAPNDAIEITDWEGGQRCELVVLGKAGGEDFGALGLSTQELASGLAAIINNGGNGYDVAKQAFKSGQVDFGEAHAAILFGEGSSAGETVSFNAERPCLCIVAAPGGPMRVEMQDPPTEIQVTVKRAKFDIAMERPLPPPLADARLDFRIPKATAQAYEVKAGEYIQVIDVDGRECSDFQAFHRADLDRGVQRDIDPTVTRYHMGTLYPGPGLFSKFYDAELRPLLEVVRDTVGRHDTFGLACNAKYYDDMGYPGHINCTDNFNAELVPYGIAPRQGWVAINFFYNTTADAVTNQISFAEPWSRPGDYVLMRAATDLVCVSSACPDDIDPANDWNPTDIHIRVYPEKNVFSKGIAYRMTPDSEPQLTRETAFHPRTSALTRSFIEYNGFWMPSSYTKYGAIDEYLACREGAVVMDLSPLRKFEVLGPDAEELLQRTLTRNVRKVAVGQVSYSAMVNETGGMLDDGTLFRLGQDNFRWIGGTDYGGIWLRQKASEMGLKAWVRSSTNQLHNIAVQGPKSRAILKEIVWSGPAQPTLEELGWFRFLIGRIGDFDGVPIVVSRTGYTGELGYEIWCHPKDAPKVWDAVWDSGEPHKLTPLGLDALDMLRIESGLIFAGHEFSDQTDPFEAGIGFAVALKSKGDEDFIGKDALIRAKQHPQRKLVGLELEGNEPSAHGDCVHVGRSQIGIVTSGMRSPLLKKNIALCRLSVEYSDIGTEVEIGKLDGYIKRIPATVVALPFYDPEKNRPRS
jgi:aminomethyltransferase